MADKDDKNVTPDQVDEDEGAHNRFYSEYDKELMELVNKLLDEADDDFTLDY